MAEVKKFAPQIESQKVPEKLGLNRVREIDFLGAVIVDRSIRQYEESTGETRATNPKDLDLSTTNKQKQELLYELGSWENHDCVKALGASNGLTGGALLGVNVHYESAKHPELNGRDWRVTNLFSFQGDTVSVTVEHTDALGGHDGPYENITIPRSELMSGLLISNEQAFLTSLPPEQQVFFREYLALLRGKSTLEDNEQTRKIIKETADKTVNLTVDKLRQGLPELPKPPDNPYQEITDWENTEDQVNRGEKPQDPTPEKIEEYETALEKWRAENATAQEQVDRFNEIFGDQIIPTPEALTKYYFSQQGKDQSFDTEVTQCKSEIERIENKQKMYEEAKKTHRILEEVDGKKVWTPVTDEEAEKQLKLLKRELSYRNKELDVAKKLQGENQGVGIVESCFEQLLAGQIDDPDAKTTAEGFASGNLDVLVKLMRKRKEEMYDQNTGKLKEDMKTDLEHLDRSIDTVNKIKKISKTVALGVALLALITLMQGMSGGGQQG